MNWLDITISDYIDLYDDIYSKDIFRIVSAVHGIPINELEEMPFEEALKLENECNFLTIPLPTNPKQTIQVGEYELHLIPFNKLEFGAFLDLERYMADPLQNMPNILSIIYRLKEERPFLTPLYEQYDDFSVRVPYYENLLIWDTWGSVYSYIKWRDNLLHSNSGLFEEKEDIDENEIVGLTSEDRKEIEKIKRVRKWGYELLIMKLANNDPTKVDEVLNFSVMKAFNLLALLQELNM